MSYFKRFTDFCGGFLAFAAMIHLLSKYMTFKATDAEGMLEKLTEFLSVEQAANYRGYAVMAGLLVISVIVGRIFERLPYISVAVSLLPLYQTVTLYASDKIEKFPALYLFLAILHTCGGIIHAILLDRADGKRRAFVCASVIGSAMTLAGAWVWLKARELMAYEDISAVEGIGRVEKSIAVAAKENFQNLLLNIVVMVAISVVVSLILKDIYFIDAILSAVAFFYTVNIVLLKDKLIIFEELTLILCALYFLTRLLLVFFEPMSAKLPKKKKKAPISKSVRRL